MSKVIEPHVIGIKEPEDKEFIYEVTLKFSGSVFAPNKKEAKQELKEQFWQDVKGCLYEDIRDREITYLKEVKE